MSAIAVRAQCQGTAGQGTAGQVTAGQGTAGQFSAEEQYFEKQVLPVLRNHCFDCHSHESGEAAGRLMLDSLAAMTDGGTRGSSVVPGKPDKSPIISAIRYEDADLQMPPDGRLADEQIEVIRKWISDGSYVPAKYRGDANENSDARLSSMAMQQAASHWAYQVPKPWSETETDLGAPAALPRTKIDAILSEKLRERGLDFSPRADRRTLIRRASYDLVGLPPSREEVARFVDDPLDDIRAFSALVDRLLTSPRFGERWARYWMDISRYADTKGYVFKEDREYPEAYRYRDWLINALNQDLPYDEFLTAQLAADLVEKQTNQPESQAEELRAAQTALGFLTLGRRFLNNQHDIIDDRLDVVSRGLMGMTLACARCHDHKYDPISQVDYYSLYGVFLNTEEPGDAPWPHRLTDAKKQRDAFVLVRGTPGNRGEKVDRRFVSFLSPKQRAFTGTGSGRLDLAKHIVASDNPLTARVFANRVWMRLTGTSLVETPSDFGIRCPPPTQLSLLDQLAIDFVDAGWSVKSLIRQIMNSDAYMQSSLDRPDAAAIDPVNELYWRMNRRRLDFEALRDTVLFRSGRLDQSLFGKPKPIEDDPSANRRTVYSYIDRQNLPSVFRTFDMASPDSHNPRRAKTSVPQQGLFLFNSGFIIENATAAGDTAKQLALSAEDSTAGVDRLFQSLLGRSPQPEERLALVEFIASADRLPTSHSAERWICGFAELDAAHGSIREFQRLTHLTNGAWQGGPTLPADSTGWCMLNADGGHAGNDAEHAAVRRWTAPRDGRLRISGTLEHKSEKGDGIRSWIITSGRSAESWVAHHKSLKTDLDAIEITAGQTIDFVTDCRENPGFDSFSWKVKLQYVDGDRAQFRSEQELPERPKTQVDAWTAAAQALLCTNELAFVD